MDRGRIVVHGTNELHLNSCVWLDKIKNLRLEGIVGFCRLADSVMMIGYEGIAHCMECSERYGERQEVVHRIVGLLSYGECHCVGASSYSK